MSGVAGDTDPGLARGAAEMVLVRYGELGLKGGNRRMFERALVRNIRHATRDVSPVRVARSRGRLTVFPERRVEAVARRLTEVFGIVSVSPAVGVEPDPEGIARTADAVLAEVLAGRPAGSEVSFRVQTSRADKSFPLNSTELDRFVADRLDPRGHRLRVQLKGAELVLGIDVRPERAYVFARRLGGPGGLPVSTQGRVVCLLSGGIDSPVAAWMAMKRGCTVSFASFHSYPFIGDSARRKVVKLVRALARWQPRNRLFVVPFTEIQVAIRDSAPEAYRTVLYRRMMQRIGERLAARERAGALVTGESLGQVASQTMENLTCIRSAARIETLRPLIGFDKLETIELARRIGTFDISSIPEPDCCTVFQPARPVIRGSRELCQRAEAELDVEGMVARALEATEVLDLEPDR